VNAIQSEDWRAPIVAALKGYYEAEDGIITKRVAIRARNYHLVDGNLYRRGVCAPLLKCISVTEGKQLLHKIHSGMCSHHLGTRALVQKAFSQGFYWPSAVADAHDIVRHCPECQRHAPYSKFASNEIQLLPPVWPFARWGIDIVGPLPTAPDFHQQRPLCGPSSSRRPSWTWTVTASFSMYRPSSRASARGLP
jgi:hypothetical protein